MPEITGLFRHPVKSLTPESCNSLAILQDGRVNGDRVLAFRFQDAGDPSDWTWQTKHNFVGLVNTPGLARLWATYDEDARHLQIYENSLLIIDGSIDDPSHRTAVSRTFTDYVMTLDENPLKDHPERCPLVLVGNGEQPLFHDSADGLITLFSTASLAALGTAVGDTELDARRFRSNIVVSGMPTAFNELSWINKSLRIGDMEFVVTKAITRCLVTHANPETGERDRDIMNTLSRQFTGDVPQFGVKLQLISEPGIVKLGDTIEIA
jgi:uncharacterized protein YcbX